MNCQYCDIEMGLIDRIRCNYCIMAENAQRIIEKRKLNRLITKTQVKEKILTEAGTNEARSLLRFLWVVPSLVVGIAAGVLLLAVVILASAIGLYYLLLTLL